MKSIMISIKPKYVVDILNGKKTIEIRKSKPNCKFPISVYIYCTGEEHLWFDKENKKWVNTPKKICHYPYKNKNKKVVAKFTLKKCDRFYYFDDDLCESACLDRRQILAYLGDKNGYAWYIDNLKIFDEPKELSEFKRCYLYWNCEYNKCKKCPHLLSLTKPFQSWGYVEEIE